MLESNLERWQGRVSQVGGSEVSRTGVGQTSNDDALSPLTVRVKEFMLDGRQVRLESGLEAHVAEGDEVIAVGVVRQGIMDAQAFRNLSRHFESHTKSAGVGGCGTMVVLAGILFLIPTIREALDHSFGGAIFYLAVGLLFY